MRKNRPKIPHYRIQLQSLELIKAAASHTGVVGMEMTFQPLPEYELRVADVAWFSQERWDQSADQEYLQGAPDLVIEGVSPSNKAVDIAEEEKLCLANGSREFWVIFPNLREGKVSTPDRITTTYREGQEIPLRLFGTSTLPAAAIFAGIPD